MHTIPGASEREPSDIALNVLQMDVPRKEQSGLGYKVTQKVYWIPTVNVEEFEFAEKVAKEFLRPKNCQEDDIDQIETGLIELTLNIFEHGNGMQLNLFTRAEVYLIEGPEERFFTVAFMGGEGFDTSMLNPENPGHTKGRKGESKFGWRKKGSALIFAYLHNLSYSNDGRESYVSRELEKAVPN